MRTPAPQSVPSYKHDEFPFRAHLTSTDIAEPDMRNNANPMTLKPNVLTVKYQLRHLWATY
ncbi:hypothetical protein WN944_012766 [Citrus x changshan-huyou]|uniref:Uncharacterized protein n=1 Tax=Citrus x changshan-huyou TaxID=2935761 RepID=A0AAP0QHD4_9ROSI